MLDSPLPMELGPTLEEQGASGLGSKSLVGLIFPQAQKLNLELLRNWGGSLLGPWLPSSLKPPKSRGLQSQNLWNPTYDFWAPRVRTQALMLASKRSSLHSSPDF